jgi:CBS domain containing-hemolysin-like protein
MFSIASDSIWKVLLVLVLVLLNGFFVAAEFAFVRIRETQLDALALRGTRRAKVARLIIANLNSFLGATQLGITMASLGLGWVGEPLFTKLLSPLLASMHVESDAMLHSLSFAIGFSLLTFLQISAGELVPKWMAIQKPVPVALWMALPLKWFFWASYPFVWVLNRTSQWLLQQIGIEPMGAIERSHSEEELRLLVSASQKYAGGTVLGRDIVLNALDLRRRIAREVMRPRQEIVGLDTEASIAQCLEVAEKTRYSRFPLCEGGDLDRTLGVLHIKDLYAMRLKARTGAELLPAARKIIYVPETSRLERLLQLFLERKLHMAIVVDEFGGTTGMVTLENILEELVGQIQDEFDQEKPLLIRISEGVWEAVGALPVHELEDLIGEPLRAESITTVSGWVTRRLGGFPKAGDVLSVGTYELRVEAMEGMRVARLKLTRKTEAAARTRTDGAME